MSKVIRKARVGGHAVVLGKDESNLYLGEQGAEEDVALADVSTLLEARVQEARDELIKEWEGRLRDEHESMKAAAQRQLAEAEERHRAEYEQVHEQRYEEGHRDGVQSKEDEAREAVSRLDALHESLKQMRRQVLIESEALVIDLTATMAHRVTGIQAEMDPTIVARVVRSALEHLSERSGLVIKVHEDDLKVARKFVAKWVEKVAADAVLRIEVSGHVERGGCMIEGKEEHVDARLEEQFQVLRDALRHEIFEENVQDRTAADLDQPDEVPADEGQTDGDRPDASQIDADPGVPDADEVEGEG